MQLNVRDALFSATCALLGSAAASSRAEATEVDAALLYYSEASRVTVNEAVANIHRALSRERFLDFTFTVDIMTGASPNGATPSVRDQIFTRPSGKGSYIVPARTPPLDDTFQDNRLAVAASAGMPLGTNGIVRGGGHYSIEYDYQSIGANTNVTRDFNRRNTTLAAGIAYSYDTLTPEGGVPVPFTSMPAPTLGAGSNKEGEPSRVATKKVFDALFGITQVLGRSTLARINYSVSRSTGYQTDPFKVLTLAAGTGAAAGEPVDYLYERRPDQRTRHAIFGMLKRHIGGDVADASYRYAFDDWKVTSHTAELRYRLRTGDRRYVQPQLRYYHQSATDFFHHFLRDDRPLPEYASADSRLAQFDAWTTAIKLGWAFNATHEVNLRVGYYVQTGEKSPPDAVGSLRELDLFPTVGAWILQIGYAAGVE